MIDKIREWAFEGEMDGFDTLASDPHEEIGFDYMSLLKGAGGMMSGAGGMMSGGQGGTTPAAPSAEAQLLALQKAEAESSARTWKVIGGIALGLIGLGGVALVMRRPA